METNPSHTATWSTSHYEHSSYYSPLPDHSSQPSPRRPLKGFAVIFASMIFLMSLVTLIIIQSPEPASLEKPEKGRPLSTKPTSFYNISTSPVVLPRGVAEGVSAKSNPSLSGHHGVSYNWTNAMFSWQRTAYHFQPQKNWMNGRYTHTIYIYFFKLIKRAFTLIFNAFFFF